MTALRLSYVALGLSILAFVLYGAVFYLHIPLPISGQVLTFLGVFSLTIPLWLYAAALYRRAVRAAK
jgi:hypothetical protein